VADVLSARQRSYCMSRIRGRDTTPELILRRLLWRAGFRYRLKSSLPGRPDIVFAGARVAVFIDGCFWHSCPEHATAPATRRAFWRKKLARNRERDSTVNRLLSADGWHVVRIWEHELKVDPSRVARRIGSTVRRRRLPKKQGP
jgi:DNA mismatch endonuclease (patch repair protein)